MTDNHLKKEKKHAIHNTIYHYCFSADHCCCSDLCRRDPPKGHKLGRVPRQCRNAGAARADYEIKAEYGHQAGTNLFHSFQQFNIHADESATFTGPDSVQNIISRVTGGDASWIDGRLASAIPNADFYFLNPAGVMFGQNASLDLGGSFHVSTGDYLRFGGNDRFYAMPLENEVLSVAAPSAFGFLDGDAGNISVEGMGELTTEVWGEDYDNWLDWWRDNIFDSDSNPNLSFFPGLVVPEGEAISLIGGDIELSGAVVDLTRDGIYRPVGANLNAPDGRINLAGIKSDGEVEMTESGLEVSAKALGNITMSDGAGTGSVEWESY